MRQGKGIFLMMMVAFCLAVFGQNVYAGNTFATAQPLQFGGDRTNFNLPADDSQYYKITTTGERAYYSLTFYNAGNNTIYFKLYEGPDTSYYKSIDTYIYGGSNKTFTRNLSPNKVYYLEVYSYNGSHGGVSVSKILDDYGNTHKEATIISLGEMKEGAIEVSGLNETDFFSFTTTKNNSYYEIGLYGTGSKSVNASVYCGPDASYEHFELSASSGDYNTKVYSLEKSHTYYICVKGHWDEATRYKVQVKEIKDDASNDFSGASKLSDGKAKSGRTETNNDVDFYKFTTAKNKTAYQLNIRNTSASSVYFTLYKRNDIASADTKVKDYSLYSGYSQTIWLNLSKKHTYYIKVTGGENATYRLSMTSSAKTIKKSAPSTFKVSGGTSWSSKNGAYAYISWKNSGKYAGYEIYRSTHKGSGYKKIKTLKDADYYYDYGIKRKKTYYYKMRYYVKDNGKIIGGKWTSVKKVRVK